MQDPMKHYEPSHPKYTSRVWQKVYFANKHMTPAERDRVATEAYDQHMREKH